MNCPKCQTRNPDEARFCFNCGAALAQTCRNCGAALQPGARFCHNCGHAVEEAEPVQAPPAKTQPDDIIQRYIPKELLTKLRSARHSHLMEGERRVVTILFCDLKGSTLAASQLDPEEWAEIINGAFGPMIDPVYRYEGTVARLQGDGLLAFFGAPIAHEDDPQRAVLAGLEIVQAVHDYGQKVKARLGIELEVRVGINTGLVVVGAVGSDLRMEYTALGDAINLASRMEQAAQPRTVLVAEATHKLTAPLFDYEEIPDIPIKGRPEPLTAYRPLARKAEPGSLRGIAGLNSPLIGRKDQLDALWSAMEHLKEGSGQIVSIMGEAGLGKSRLITEFSRAVAAEDEGHPTWLEGKALSYETGIPFAAFIDLFKTFFGLYPGDSEALKYERVESRCESLFPGRGQEIAPFFGTLLGLQLSGEAAERVRYIEPPRLRGIIFAQTASLLENLTGAESDSPAGMRPVILFVDDLHWADPTSLDLLQSLLPLTDRLPLMVIAAFRPRRMEPSWGFHEYATREYPHRYQMISLAPLDGGQASELVANLLAVEDLPKKTRQMIMEKSEGNPFFIEEIIRSMLDRGLIVQENSHWRATQEIERIDLPGTLNGVITARLDRLEDSARLILQSAAVLGREFSLEVLSELVDAPELVEQTLTELQRRELVREKSRFPEPRFAFKHVLTQEAAYDSILLSNRRELHRMAADSLAKRYPEAAAEIARHLLEAHQVGRAVPYLVQAGDQAARAYATTEAIHNYQQAIEHRDAVQDPDLVRRAYEGLGSVLLFSNQIPEALKTYQDLLAIGEAQAHLPTRLSAMNKLASVYALRMGDFQKGEALLTQVNSLSRQSDDKSAIPEAALIRCQVCSAKADFKSVVDTMAEVVALGKELSNQEYVMLGLAHVAISLVQMIQFDEAKIKAAEGLRVAREIGDREHEAVFLVMPVAQCHIRDGDFTAAKEALQEGLQIGRKIGSLLPQIFASYLLGDIARWQGEYESALSYGELSLETAMPMETFLPFLLVLSLGSLGITYLEISPKFTDKIAEFHLHALHLLESPMAAMGGGTAWSDLGLCALTLGDLKVAEESIQKGLNYPNSYMLLERPRQLAAAALLANAKGDQATAIRRAEQACQEARKSAMQDMYPFTSLVLGQMLLAAGDCKASLETLKQAEAEARALEMRPVLWQASLEMAKALDRLGEADQAETMRNQARAVAEEIAGLFADPALRQAYLENVGRNSN
jgi:class 3 adenylate cyclase/tetratricopeptide (TPR) repeat protein